MSAIISASKSKLDRPTTGGSSASSAAARAATRRAPAVLSARGAPSALASARVRRAPTRSRREDTLATAGDTDEAVEARLAEEAREPAAEARHASALSERAGVVDAMIVPRERSLARARVGGARHSEPRRIADVGEAAPFSRVGSSVSCLAF